MSSTILKLLLLLGIIGHACNMYCDRILSIFPNGQLKLENFKDLNNEKKWHTFLKGYPQNFTILPIFILLFPFRIIGTLHIAAMTSMLVWMILP